MGTNFHKLDSSSIDSIDYHDDKGTLEIKFVSGAIYHYPECDKEHYEALKTASSAGQYFHRMLRGAACKRIN